MEMDDHKRRRTMILYVILAMAVYLVLSTLLFPNLGQRVQINQVSYTQFLDDLDEKKVAGVDYNTGDATAVYTLKKDVGEDGSTDVAYQTTVMPNDSDLTNRIVDAGASLDVTIPSNDGNIWIYFLIYFSPIIIFLLFGWWLNRRMKKAMGDDGPSMNFGSRRLRRHGRRPRQERRAQRRHPKDVGVTFKDVAGQEEAKESLKEVVDFLENPKRYEDIGARSAAGRPARRPSGYRQDAARQGRRRRGGRAVLHHLGLRVRRDVRRTRRRQGPRPLQAGQ